MTVSTPPVRTRAPRTRLRAATRGVRAPTPTPQRQLEIPGAGVSGPRPSRRRGSRARGRGAASALAGCLPRPRALSAAEPTSPAPRRRARNSLPGEKGRATEGPSDADVVASVSALRRGKFLLRGTSAGPRLLRAPRPGRPVREWAPVCPFRPRERQGRTSLVWRPSGSSDATEPSPAASRPS